MDNFRKNKAKEVLRPKNLKSKDLHYLSRLYDIGYINMLDLQDVKFTVQFMVAYNKHKDTKGKEQFTKSEVKAKNPGAWEIVYFNRYTKGEQFTKDELKAKNPNAEDMISFNKYTKGKELFSGIELFAKNECSFKLGREDYIDYNIVTKEVLKKYKPTLEAILEFNKNTKGVQFIKSEVQIFNIYVHNILDFNEHIRTEKFTKSEFLEKKPRSYDLTQFNRFVGRLEGFTKSEFLESNPNGSDMLRFNLSTKNKGLFSTKEIIQKKYPPTMLELGMYNKHIKTGGFNKSEYLTQNPDAFYMLYFNSNTESVQFTKEELMTKNPTASGMVNFNESTKGEQFTKAEITAKNPDAYYMVLFNESTKGKELFTQTEINNA